MKCVLILAAIFAAALSDKVASYGSGFRKLESNEPIISEIDDTWWRNALVYQIYPRSFKDSNNDGDGDLQGIFEKLDYLQEIGVDAIWLSPIYNSPQVDNGYDISDYRSVDPMYGTMDDLRRLIDETHARDIKFLLDYVPGYTSDQHPWFQASVKKDPNYDDYYVWRNANYVFGERLRPNNWNSVFGGPSWTWNEERQQYFLHTFTPQQPDLNYRSPKLVEEMKDLLRFWLDYGVDGFRMDAIDHLVEDDRFLDEPRSYDPDRTPDDWYYYNHIYTLNQPLTYEIVYQFRAVLDEFTKQNGTHERIMMTEVYGPMNTTVPYFGSEDGTRVGAHFSFNFNTFILDLAKGFNAGQLFNAIDDWISNLPKKYNSNWVLGNHDQPRVGSRLGSQYRDSWHMLISLLPGAEVTYMAEEIGQENGEVTCEEGYDPQAIKNCTSFPWVSRDFARTPVQWDTSVNAGFNEGAKPWLPVSKEYNTTNVAVEDVEGLNSHLNIYKKCLKLRKEFKLNPVSEWLNYGVKRNIFYASRETDEVQYQFVLNVAEEEGLVPENLACDNCTKVVIANEYSQYKVGDIFNATIPLKGYEALVLGK